LRRHNASAGRLTYITNKQTNELKSASLRYLFGATAGVVCSAAHFLCAMPSGGGGGPKLLAALARLPLSKFCEKFLDPILLARPQANADELLYP
jgi:hypothetical protein